MTTVLNNNVPFTDDWRDEQTWVNLINLLRVRTRRLVYSARVVSWRGQEEDIIEDVVQETIRRIFERYQRAERGEALPIYSPEHMAVRIARNYLMDMRRHDCRLQRISSECSYLEEACSPGDGLNSFEMALEHVMQEELFAQLAHVIVLFPEKRRTALLIDLANRMCLHVELTPLQKAFLAEGIDFQAYQQALPTDSAGRARHSALMNLAYKQITMIMHEHSL